MLKAGFYEKVITPPLGCDMRGYFQRRIANDVVDDIYAKACVVDNDKEKIAFLAIDICGLYQQHITDDIIKRITKFTDIKAENILICSTHNHTAGPVGEYPEVFENSLYIDMFICLAADAVTLANQRMKEVSAKYICPKAENIAFVRDYKMKGGYIASDPGIGNPDNIGPAAESDDDLPVLAFFDKSDKPCGAIVAFACHQDCVGTSAYSGDFSGAMNRELKKEYGQDFVSVFFEGTCGNINHFNLQLNSAEELPAYFGYHRKVGRILANEIISGLPYAKSLSNDEIVVLKEKADIKKVKFTAEEVEAAKAFIKECEGENLVPTSLDPESKYMKLNKAKRIVKYMQEDANDLDVYVMVIKIGDFVLAAFPFEIFVQFGKMIKERTALDKIMVVELAFVSAGYIPTKDVINEPRVYEAAFPSRVYEPDAGYIMTDKLCNMIEEFNSRM